MYYLVKETMGMKRCIDINENDIYEDGQSYDCLKTLPFDETGVVLDRSIKIRCINTPGRKTTADVYKD
jgi:hypothetical protein